MDRASEFQSRIPGFESCPAVLNVGQVHLAALFQFNQQRLKEYMAVDIVDICLHWSSSISNIKQYMAVDIVHICLLSLHCSMAKSIPGKSTWCLFEEVCHTCVKHFKQFCRLYREITFLFLLVSCLGRLRWYRHWALLSGTCDLSLGTAQ